MLNQHIYEQYRDDLSLKVERIERMMQENKITKKLARKLLSFYIKKEIKQDISNTFLFDNKSKMRQIVLSYRSKSQDFYAL